MKKNILKASLLLSPLFLSGCHTPGDLFGEPAHPSHQPYQTYSNYGKQNQPNNVQRASGDASSSTAAQRRPYQAVHKTSAVPLQAPTVDSASEVTHEKASDAVSNAGNNALESVPPAPTVMPTSAPAMAAPAVGE